MRYDTDWFESIDDRLNNGNYNKSYSIIIKDHQKKVYDNNKIEGIRPLYIKQTNRYYLPKGLENKQR